MKFAKNVTISRQLVGSYSWAKSAALKLLRISSATLPIDRFLWVHILNQQTILNSDLVIDIRENYPCLIVKLFSASTSKQLWFLVDARTELELLLFAHTFGVFLLL